MERLKRILKGSLAAVLLLIAGTISLLAIVIFFGTLCGLITLVAIKVMNFLTGI